MKAIYILLGMLACSLQTGAQPAFQKYLAAPERSGVLYRCIQSSDGGFVAIGNIYGYTTFPISNQLLVKTDPDGNASWIKEIHNSFYDNTYTDIIETDGGFVFPTTIITSNKYQAAIEKIDANGARIWNKTFVADEVSSFGRRIIKDDAGNLYVLGIMGESVYFILKLDPSGNIVHQATVNTADSGIPTAFLRNSDGEFFIVSVSFGNTIIVKLSPAFSVMWSKRLSSYDYVGCGDMKEKVNGNLVITGKYYYESTNDDVMLAEIDANTGDVVWVKRYAWQTDNSICANGLIIDPDGSITVTGKGGYPSGMLLFGTDSQGEFIWSETFSTDYGEGRTGDGITETSDGGYAVCGSSWGDDNSVVHLFRVASGNEGSCIRIDAPLTEETVWMTAMDQAVTSGTCNFSIHDQETDVQDTELDSWSDICPVTAIREQTGDPVVSVHPNPSDGAFTISAGDPGTIGSVRIVNSVGAEVFFVPASGKAVSEDMTVSLNVPAGIYFILIEAGERQITSKIIIE